ncbi:ejaculatory bulb-specific protein 3 [Anoplophora glabripennis]|uniref:ejaculatory bulb-specific protein 3 n=1 Tax=Anoplophora glabripennis TaxID=217634 RepID=UPI000874A336|nr:ejaculatory bulb-specific protein 3 [Anoplophora glabripennis]
MYFFSGLVCLICISSVIGQKYSNKYDHIDIDRILSNKRVLNNYIKCILDQGPCTPDGREFRDHVPEAITTNCAKCTEAQINIIRKTSVFIMKKRPEDWEKIKNKFDPQEKYKDSFMKFINGHN